jgi:hypothetical protein
MDKKSANFNKLLKSIKDKWVAVSDDYSRVFSSGNTLESIVKKVKTSNNVKMFRVMPFDVCTFPQLAFDITYSPCYNRKTRLK